MDPADAARFQSDPRVEHLGPLHEGWVPIPIPCNHFPSDTWIYLAWSLERVGNQVHYISLSVADQNYRGRYLISRPNRTGIRKRLITRSR